MKLSSNIRTWLSSSLAAFTIGTVALLSSCGGKDPVAEVPLSITSFTPTAGSDGTVVKITGTGFSATTAENQVTFGTASATVTAATETQLTVNLPPSLPYGAIKITVTTGGKSVESASSFTAGLELLEGDITTDKRLVKTKRYLLKGKVLVTGGATLTIDPGVIIKGDKASAATLIIGRGAKINAVGTAQEPIVFTSNQSKGNRSYGDWGGVILLGKAPVNQQGDQNIEGLASDPRYTYGGTDSNDNSGTLKYVRIEFCGIALIVGSEINGLTLGGVGAGTTIDYVQVSYSGDDSFEWFGGSVNAKHLISFRGFDDDFDTDLGYSGKVQFGLGLRDPYVADASQSNGFESDNSPSGTGTFATSAIFSNITCVGGASLARGTSTQDKVENSNFGRGAHLRRATAQSIFNSVLVGSNLAGFSIDGSNAQTNFDTGEIQLKGNVLSGTRPLSLPARGGDFAYENDGSLGFAAPPAVLSATFSTNNLINQPLADLKIDNLVTFNRLTNPELLPSGSSILLTGGAIFTGKADNAFFEKVNYKGAFGTTNWALGWTNFDPQNLDY
jgi:hypothetical protein